MLEVEAEGVYTMIYVQKGVPVFAEEGTLGETLGRILLREGDLSQDQYARIIEHMTSTVMGAEQMRFGEVAVSLGFMNPEQINEALAKQVRRKVLRCLDSASAEGVFREGADELEGIARYPCPVPPLVLRAVCSTFEEERVSRMLEGAASAYPDIAGDRAEISARFKMDPAETAFLDEISGSSTAFQLIYTAGLGGLHASQMLAVLIASGDIQLLEEPVVTPEPEPPPEPKPAVVRIEPTHVVHSQPAAVRAPMPRVVARVAVRQRLARRMAKHDEPAKVAGAKAAATAGSSAPAKKPSEPVKKQSDRPKSLPPATKGAKLRAEKLFQSGKLHVRHERWPLAVKDLQEASRLYPSAAEYELYLEWATLQTLADAAEIAMRRDRLEELALGALRQDRQMAFAHHVIAQVKLMHGDEKGAARSFRVASKLDANDKVAARYFRMLSRKLG